MKTTLLSLLVFGLTLACHGQASAARYNGTLDVGNTNHSLSFRLYVDNRVELCVDSCAWFSWGRWTENRAVRSFTILTETNAFIATVRKGVVTGTFENYVTGEKGTFRCDVPR